MSHGVVKKKGYLLKLPVTGMVKKWAKRWCVLYATSHEGVVRIEYYTDEVSERSQIGKRTIPLRDCSKIQQTVGDKAHPYVFEFTTQLGQHIFAADSQPELDGWLDGIKDSVHEDRMKRKMNRQSKKVDDSQAPARPPQPQGGNRGQSNDAGYTPVLAGGFSKGSTHTASNITSGTYRVTLEENDTTDEHNLHGSFNLILAPTTIALADVDTGKPIYKWSYKNLRSFGKQSGRFNFDVGKTQQGGTGSYRCITSCSKEIFGVVNRNIKTIRERLEASRKDSQPVRHSRKSGVADDSIPGKYRASQDLEDVGTNPGESTKQPQAAAQNGALSNQDVENNYTLAAEENREDPDIAALYAKVQKRPKGDTAPTQEPQATEAAAPSNRFSYDTSLDARDSALIQLDGPMLDLEALTPKQPAPDLSNIMDLELNNDFFAQTTSTAATGVDPWGGGGGGQAAGTGVTQSSPWGMQPGGGQQYTQGGGQQYGGQQQYMQGGGQPYMQGGGQPFGGGGQPFGGYGQPAGYARPAQGQTGGWGMQQHGLGQQHSGFGAPPQAPAQQQAQAQAPQKALSQDEFDKLWDELCTPTTNF